MQLSTNELAEILELSPRQIQNLANQGILTKAERGCFDASTAVGEFIKYKLGQHCLTTDLKEAQTRKELALAQLKEFDLAQKEKELISVDKVEYALSIIAKTLSNKLYSLPAKINREIAISQEINTAIKDAIHEILTELKEPLEYDNLKI